MCVSVCPLVTLFELMVVNNWYITMVRQRTQSDALLSKVVLDFKDLTCDLFFPSPPAYRKR